jgi:hypothetical protein
VKVLGWNPRTSPFMHIVIKKNWQGLSLVEMLLEWWADRTCHQIWWNRCHIWRTVFIYIYIDIYFLIIQFLGVIGHFLTATWQPMTGPHGSQSLAHNTSLYSHLTTSPYYHVTMPCVVQMPCNVWMPCVLYGLPRGNFSLVHKLSQKVQK